MAKRVLPFLAAVVFMVAVDLTLVGCGVPPGLSSAVPEWSATAESQAVTEEKKQSEEASTVPQAEITLAVVNNPDLNLLEQLSATYSEQTGVKLNFAIIPENELRQQVQAHAATGGGRYDIVQVGTYEAGTWGKFGWIENLEPFFESMTDERKDWYDRGDLIGTIRTALSYNGNQYGLAFYGESSMTYYNKEIFAAKNLVMPENPTWDDIYTLAKRAHDPGKGIYGMTMRGQPGWGMNGAVIGSMIHAFGGRFFDENWMAALDSPEAREAFEMYRSLLVDAGQPDSTAYGGNECLQLMSEGKAAIFYDATIFAGTLEGKESKVKGRIGYAPAPVTDRKTKNTGWLWAWAFAIDANSTQQQTAFDYLTWATSREYAELVASRQGWARAPAGVRVSTYLNPDYQKDAPFAGIVLEAINSVDYENAAVPKVPYVGVQYIGIPEFADFGTTIMEYLAQYVEGSITVEELMRKANEVENKAAKDGGYQQ